VSFCLTGAVNEGFSDSLECFSSASQCEQDDCNETYFVPRCGPKIRVVRSSIRRPHPTGGSSPGLDPRFLMTKVRHQDSFRRHSDIGICKKESFDCEKGSFDQSFSSPSHIWTLSPNCLHDELGVSGQARRHSCDSMSLYEKLQQSRRESGGYQTLPTRRLCLPPRPREFSPLMTPRVLRPGHAPHGSQDGQGTRGGCSAGHTYASIHDLTGEVRRGDDVDTAENDLNISSDGVFMANNNMSSPACVTNISAGNTYESIWPGQQGKNSGDSAEELSSCAAVIIGRKVSNPFSFTKESICKMSQNNVPESTCCHIDSKPMHDVERYSPFPNAKKLALKSVFKRLVSSKFTEIPTMSSNIERKFNCTQEFCADNVRTPEIKVENIAQNFNSATFVSPEFTTTKHAEPLSPCNEPTYESIWLSENARKFGSENLDTMCREKVMYRKSLPSLPGDLKADLASHCALQCHLASTPNPSLTSTHV